MECNTKNKKLAILGKMHTRDLCPYEDENFDIWQINHHTTKPKRVDMVVDLHINGHDGDINYNNFPFKEVSKIVGGVPLNNTLSYLLVYAYMLGYREIYTYGCRFNSFEEERLMHRKNVQCVGFFVQSKGVVLKSPYDNLFLDFKEYIDWKM